jgi:flagellar hook-associated protein 1 FlgK
VVHLGVEAQSTYRRVTMQAAATRQVDAARDAVSGVNIDEEMVNMIQFEHAYNASARVMTAIDEMLDTLITRTGVVGR